MTEESEVDEQLKNWEKALEKAKQEGKYIKHPVFGDVIGYSSVKEFDEAMREWSIKNKQHPLSPPKD